MGQPVQLALPYQPPGARARHSRRIPEHQRSSKPGWQQAPRELLGFARVVVALSSRTAGPHPRTGGWSGACPLSALSMGTGSPASRSLLVVFNSWAPGASFGEEREPPGRVRDACEKRRHAEPSRRGKGRGGEPLFNEAAVVGVDTEQIRPERFGSTAERDDQIAI